jgi:glycosyltransferase involved in cell wall biosynthesis
VTVSYYSPMPPAASGVADYSAALVDALRERMDVRVNEPGGLPLYHLGNNRQHAEIYPRALMEPGIAVLHDAVLHHFLLGFLNEREYLDEFAYNYGEWSRGEARQLWANRARSGTDPAYFRYPMLRRIVERSRAVIVHNPGARGIVESLQLGVPVFEVPHLWVPKPLPPPGERCRLRQEWGIPPGAFLFGVFGFLRETKRIHVVLQATLDLLRECAPVRLVVAGDFVSPGLGEGLTPLLRRAGAVRLGYLSEDLFWKAAVAIDGCINLRYPGAGETSGIAIRMMGAGKPVILSDVPDNARFPEPACVRIDAGASERAMLREVMRWFALYPRDALAIGARGAQHISANHNVELAVTGYLEVFEAVNESKDLPPRAVSPGSDGPNPAPVPRTSASSPKPPSGS